jgi:hypothetical protein
MTKIKETEVFADTTSGVMVRNQPVIHLSILVRKEIGHPQSRTKIKKKDHARYRNKQNQSQKSDTKTDPK